MSECCHCTHPRGTVLFFSIISCFQYLLHLTIAVEFLSFFFHSANDKRHQRKHFSPFGLTEKLCRYLPFASLHFFFFFFIFFFPSPRKREKLHALALTCARLLFSLIRFSSSSPYSELISIFAAHIIRIIIISQRQRLPIFFASSFAAASALYFRHRVYVAMARTHVILK